MLDRKYDAASVAGCNLAYGLVRLNPPRELKGIWGILAGREFNPLHLPLNPT